MKASKQRGSAMAYLMFIAIMALAAGGWVANFVKLIGLLDGPITGWVIARGIGVFAAPFGAVLGYF